MVNGELNTLVSDWQIRNTSHTTLVSDWQIRNTPAGFGNPAGAAREQPRLFRIGKSETYLPDLAIRQERARECSYIISDSYIAE